MIRFSDIVQGSPEWHALRVGIPTSSGFDRIITTKGDPSKSRTKYMYQLAGERICGYKEETYQSAAMTRGIEMEEEARDMFAMTVDEPVEKIGFCIDDKKLYGASPDGFIGEDGCLEIKCPTIAVHVEYLLDNSLPTAYFQQVQGQLCVTDRKYAMFVSYFPGLKPLIIRVERNEKFISSLKDELKKFCVELDDITQKLK